MRHSNFTAVYDACVLYPAPLRVFLMWLGLSGCFRARWSSQIRDEWKRSVLRDRPDLTADANLDVLLRQGYAQTTQALSSYRAIL